MRGNPHCTAHNFRGIGAVACNVEETMLDAPVAAKCEGDTVARQ
jgi:hypothetical protein